MSHDKLFKYWAGRTSATVYEFTALSYGYDPLTKSFEDREGRQMCLLDALEHQRLRSLGQRKTMTKNLPKDGPLHPVDQLVDLHEAVAFARGVGWEIPAELARLQTVVNGDSSTLDADKPTNGSGHDTPINGVTVNLPHMTNALEIIFRVMHEQWANYDPARPPKSVNVAHELDKALGWKTQSDGKPSRGAQTLAAAMRPDELAESDGRNTRR